MKTKSKPTTYTYNVMLWKSDGTTERFFEVTGRDALKAAVEAHGCVYDGFAESFYAADKKDRRWVEVYGATKVSKSNE